MKIKFVFLLLISVLASNFLYAQSGCSNVYYYDNDSDGYGTSAVFSGGTSADYGSGQYLGWSPLTFSFPTPLNNLSSFYYSVTNTAATSDCWFYFYSGGNVVGSLEINPYNGLTFNSNHSFPSPLNGVTSVVIYSYWNPSYLNDLTFTTIPSSVTACTQPAGYALNNTDCNDGNSAVNPGIFDICNSIDDNCDGQVDNGRYYADTDGDGYGVYPGVVTQENSTIIIGPSGVVINGANILDQTTYTPNVTSAIAFVVPTTTTYTFNWTYTTLDDSGPSYDPAYFINGQVFQLSSNNGIYYQSGSVTVQVTAGSTFGFGVVSTDGGLGQAILTISNFNGLSNIGAGVLACAAPVGYVTNHNDCNDNIANIHPGANEICNSADDDCDTQIDDDVSTAYYVDADGDGYGANSSITTQGNSTVIISPNTIVINGSNDLNFINGGTNIQGQIEFLVPITTTYTFNWNYVTSDPDGPELDPAYYINNTLVQLSNNLGNNSQSGSVSINVTAGSTFGFAIISTDGIAGQATLTITNFNGISNIPSGILGCSAPVGYVSNSGDCNDNLSAIHSGATELCNTIDDDCDGVVDDGVNTFYADTDGDGYGAGVATITCTGPTGYVLNNGDCNNNSAAIHPLATEICNNVDEDCDGVADDGLPLITRYLDNDGDGFGNVLSPSSNCSGTFPSNYVANSTDCNDNLSAVNPAAIEVCNNIDDNCNAQIDEGVQSIFYADADGDGFGSTIESFSCSAPTGFVANNSDCNDGNSLINPGATEVCNSIDDNCDGQIDVGLNTYYADNDGDGFGAGAVTITCSPSAGFVLNNADCNDNASAVYPGATEICNSIDDDCDTEIDEGVLNTYYVDTDGDGYGFDAVTESFAPGSWVLYTPSAFVLVGTQELWIGVSNSIQFVAPTTETYTFNWAYAILDDPDQDPAYYFVNNQAVQLSNELGALYQSGSVTVTVNAGDVFGFGINSWDDEAGPVWLEITNFNARPYMGIAVGCSQPAGYVVSNNDCNNSNAAVNPGATEICNNIDDNCDSEIDEDVQNTYYADTDGDGFGGNSTTLACTVPTGYSSNNLDCNENVASINPGANEMCNSIDDNCNGQTDEGVQSIFYYDGDNDGFGTSAVFSGTTAQNYGAGQYLGSWGYTVNFPTTLNNLVSFNYSITNTAAMSQCVFRFYSGGNLIATVEAYPQNGETINTIYNFSSPLYNVTSVQVFSYWNPAYLNSLTFSSFPSSVSACAQPANYVSNNTDCNDGNAAVNPGAIEICNTVDDNCDSGIDDALYYVDADNDGYGNASTAGVLVCLAPTGYVANNDDCDDTIDSVYLGSTEVCNSIDDDCDTQIDEGVQNSYYADTDGDGYGAGVVTIACTAPTGFVTTNTDCDNTNATVNPLAIEVCNSIDDDCDTQIDEGVQNIFYADNDGDGFGAGVSLQSCVAPVGYVSSNNDCNDIAANVNPGAQEICNSIDDNCDTQIDEGLLNLYYVDTDADGYGSDAVSETFAPGSWISYIPTGFVLAGTQDYFYGVSNKIEFVAPITETYTFDWAYAILDDPDQDPAYYFINNQAVQLSDELGALYQTGSISVSVNAGDVFGFGINSLDDEAGPVWLAITNFNANPYLGIAIGCTQPTGYALSNNDCNNSNASVNPGATEVCNSIDDDCDTQIDEGVQNSYYADLDGDGYGSGAVTMACSAPGGMVGNNTDCDDALAAVHPGATEICNSVDDDCEGGIDETGAIPIAEVVSSCGPYTWSETNTTYTSSGTYYANIPTASTYSSYATFVAASNSAGYQLSETEDFSEFWGYSANANGTFGVGFPTWSATATNGFYANSINGSTTLGTNQYATALTFQFSTGVTGVGGNFFISDVFGGIIETTMTVGLSDGTSITLTVGSPDSFTGFTSNGTLIESLTINTPWISLANPYVRVDNLIITTGTPAVSCSADVLQLTVSTPISYYADLDGDGFGAGAATSVCSQPNGYVSNNTDCDDALASINSGATEICNSIDDDCDAQIDEGLTFTNYYADLDGDGYGAGPATNACVQPTGFVTTNTDCNNNNIAVNPVAIEVCNSIDDDCDTQIDEGIQPNMTNVVSCGPYTWNQNNTTYNTSGTYYTNIPGASTHNTYASFTSASNIAGYQLSQTEDFSEFGGYFTSASGNFGAGFPSWSATGVSGFFAYQVNGSTAIAANQYASALTFNFSSGVTGVGGNFFVTDVFGNVISNTVNITLSDGTTQSLWIASSNSFTGYISNGTPITSITINTPWISQTNPYVRVDNLVVLTGTPVVACSANVLQLTVNNPVSYFADSDGDGYGSGVATLACTAPAGFVTTNTDCNNNNAAVNPTATEVCNNIDDDCDSQIDEGVQNNYYVDTDGDGYGAGTSTAACTAPTGFVTTNTDCNNNNAAVNPTATEVCNNIDDDCDSQIDEGVQNSYYADTDGDGYGAGAATLACTAPTGFVTTNTDCNNNNAAVNPAATEVCNNIDDDCDTQVDEGVQNNYYVDTDGDGYGAGAATAACTAPTGFVTTNTDCNNTNAAVNPAATEVCNSIDDDCDTQVDEGVQNNYYVDTDGDGYGAGTATAACTAPTGYVSTNTDCNNTNAAVNPAATEVCNSIDDDCDTQVDEGVQNNYYVDTDGDGYGAGTATAACTAPTGYVSTDTDCNNTNAAVNPGATEVCNTIDDDCDSQIDEGLTFTNYYADVDGDGYGAGTATNACAQPVGFVTTNTDCNNNSASVNPGATEVCGNGVDENCNGSDTPCVVLGCTDVTACNYNPLANFSDASCLYGSNFYADTDGDGYGAGTATVACTAPIGMVANNTDCNNANASIHAGATEICNMVDEDCDTQVDEGLPLINYYSDVDADTYGGALVSTTCSILTGYVTIGGDCNDNNVAINPGAVEVCINSIDDDCDGIVNDGCLPDQLLGESPATSQYVWTNFFPSCVAQSHTLTGFTSSLSSQSMCITGEDKWHYFTANSEAVSIQVSSTANDILLELQNANGTMVATENAVAGLGGEILNFSGLTAGQIYKVGVRNYNSALGIGAYSICIKMLKRGGCDYGSGPYTLCQYFKAAFAGAGAVYTFTFTGVSGPATGNVYTRTQTSDICVLSNVSPALPYGSTYNVFITSTYNLLDGAGNSEIISVPALSSCTMITTAQPVTALRATDQCSAGPRFRGATVASLPWVCGATNWRWEFTELNAVGQPVGLPIVVNRGAASNYMTLSTVAQLQYGKTYAVRTAPIMPYTGSNYQWGPTTCMSIVGTAGMIADGQDGSESSSKVEIANDVNMYLYPNPTHGTDVNISLSGVTSDNVQIRVVDAMGRQVWSNRYAVNGILNTNLTFEQPLANGLYFVEAIFNGEVQTQRLMVQK